LKTAAIIVGYGMSRLDQSFLLGRGHRSWRAAFTDAGRRLRVPPASLKNLRDEFDPYHPNQRSGWRGRALRPNRRRVLEELSGVSDGGLMALLDELLAGRRDDLVDALDSLAPVNGKAAHVAERLRTGRLAEEWFLSRSESILGIPTDRLLDRRQEAAGYDFGVADAPDRAIEIKGLKSRAGEVLFTDREWAEAALRRERYTVVVVANLATEPAAIVIHDPHAALPARIRCRRTVALEWACRIRRS
jgi:hypothetical protein